MKLKYLTLVILVDLARSKSFDSADIGASETTCATARNCDECLADDNNCVWMAGQRQCLSSCVNFPDKNCYHPRLFGPATTDRQEICKVSQLLRKDNDKCFRQTDPIACHMQMGCYWLSGVTDARDSTSWCVLHLESTQMDDFADRTYKQGFRSPSGKAIATTKTSQSSHSSGHNYKTFSTLALGSVIVWLTIL